LGLEGVNVRFVPWRERTEFKDLLAFDVGIMPLEDTAWSRYKCGLKILQYMAIGIPAVASPVGVNSDIIRTGENGFLPESSSDWVQILQHLTSHQELRLRIGAAGRRTVEQSYSVESQLPRLVEVLAEAVSRTTGKT
jgi:glycosyltransferase involved in cell wall biosynthesis